MFTYFKLELIAHFVIILKANATRINDHYRTYEPSQPPANIAHERSSGDSSPGEYRYNNTTARITTQRFGIEWLRGRPRGRHCDEACDNSPHVGCSLRAIVQTLGLQNSPRLEPGRPTGNIATITTQPVGVSRKNMIYMAVER